MHRKPDPQVAKALLITAELFGHTFSRETAEMFAGDLADYPAPAVLSALGRCRKECHRFPSVAQVIERIDDGRPGPEEAWAMIPKDESGSVVWTDEMAEAFGHARELLPDEIAARMAFREAYMKLVSAARSTGKQAQWSPSFGPDRAGQAAAVEEATRKQRISLEHAAALIPDLSAKKPVALLEGPEEPPADPERVKAIIKDAFKKVRDAGGMNFLDPRRCHHELGPVLRKEEQVLGERWIHGDRECRRVGNRYLVIYRECRRCESTIPENFPLND